MSIFTIFECDTLLGAFLLITFLVWLSCPIEIFSVILQSASVTKIEVENNDTFCTPSCTFTILDS